MLHRSLRFVRWPADLAGRGPQKSSKSRHNKRRSASEDRVQQIVQTSTGPVRAAPSDALSRVHGLDLDRGCAAVQLINSLSRYKRLSSRRAGMTSRNRPGAPCPKIGDDIRNCPVLKGVIPALGRGRSGAEVLGHQYRLSLKRMPEPKQTTASTSGAPRFARYRTTAGTFKR